MDTCYKRIWHPVLKAVLSSLSVQNVLPQIPKLKHVICVDQKKVSTEGYPAGLSIHSMEAVRELGALPENSVYFSDSPLWFISFSFFLLCQIPNGNRHTV